MSDYILEGLDILNDVLLEHGVTNGEDILPKAIKEIKRLRELTQYQFVSVDDEKPRKGEIVLSYNELTGVNMALYSECEHSTNGFELLHWGKNRGVWYPHISKWMKPVEPTK